MGMSGGKEERVNRLMRRVMQGGELAAMLAGGELPEALAERAGDRLQDALAERAEHRLQDAVASFQNSHLAAGAPHSAEGLQRLLAEAQQRLVEAAQAATGADRLAAPPAAPPSRLWPSFADGHSVRSFADGHSVPSFANGQPLRSFADGHTMRSFANE